MTPTSQKICVACKKSCDGQPRIKDPKGRYFHQQCFEDVKRAHRKQQQEQERAAAEAFELPAPAPSDQADGDDDIMSLLLDDVAAAPPVMAGGAATCPSCGHALGAGAVICLNCGFNAQLGHAVKPTVERKASGSIAAQPVKKYLLFAVASLFLILTLATFLFPPIALAHLVLAVFVAIAWSLYIIISAFCESAGTGLKVMFVPFYQWIFMHRSHDLIVRRGFWVMIIGIATFAASASFHLSRIDDWAQTYEEEKLGPRSLYGRGTGKPPAFDFSTGKPTVSEETTASDEPPSD